MKNPGQDKDGFFSCLQIASSSLVICPQMFLDGIFLGVVDEEKNVPWYATCFVTADFKTSSLPHSVFIFAMRHSTHAAVQHAISMLICLHLCLKHVLDITAQHMRLKYSKLTVRSALCGICTLCGFLVLLFKGSFALSQEDESIHHHHRRHLLGVQSERHWSPAWRRPAWASPSETWLGRPWV